MIKTPQLPSILAGSVLTIIGLIFWTQQLFAIGALENIWNVITVVAQAMLAAATLMLSALGYRVARTQAMLAKIQADSAFSQAQTAKLKHVEAEAIAVAELKKRLRKGMLAATFHQRSIEDLHAGDFKIMPMMKILYERAEKFYEYANSELYEADDFARFGDVYSDLSSRIFLSSLNLGISLHAKGVSLLYEKSKGTIGPISRDLDEAKREVQRACNDYLLLHREIFQVLAALHETVQLERSRLRSS